MHRFFSKLPVSGRLWMVLMLAIPLSAVLFISARLIAQKKEEVARMELFDSASHLVSAIGDVVHELQKERGLSVGFVSSANGAFKDGLARQRAATDASIAALIKLQAGLPDAVSRKVENNLGQFARRAALLQAMRGSIDARTASHAGVLDHYSQTAQLLLDAILQLPQNTADGEMAPHFIAYYHVQNLKENAGIQRAILTRALTVRGMSPQDYGMLLGAATLEARSLGSFNSLAPPALREKLRQALNGPGARKADELRDAALAKGLQGPPGGDADRWNEYQTQKIDRINEFSDSLEALSLASVDGRLAATKKSLGRYQSAMLAAVLTVLVTAFFFLRSIAAVKENERNLAAAMDDLESSYLEQTAIMEAIPDILYVFNKRGELMKWNSNLAKFCGLAPVDMMGRSALEFACAEDRETLQNGMMQVFREGAANIEMRLVRHDGAFVPYWCNAVLLKKPDGKIAGFTGTGRDMTDQKRNEAILKQAKENAEEATALKDKFVSLVAHDLKSPLAAMTGFLKLAANDPSNPLSEKTRQILERALETGDQSLILIDEVLSLSRLKTGSLKLDMKFFDANFIGRKMMADHAFAAEQKGIELRNEIPPNSRIRADKTLLAEVIGNLVANAVKYCKKDDRIVISWDGPSTISVIDSGRGMERQTLENLFNNPGSKTGTAGEVGTGYGLALVKEVVDLHSGELTVRSEEGKGCHFTVSLPGHCPRILVVDDDDVFRLTQRAHLAPLDVEVLEAANGMDALSLIARRQPHLVIADIGLPVLGGLELLERVKGSPDTQHIPVIMVSGMHGMEMQHAVFSLGASDFALKPWDAHDFIPRVRRFIG